MYTGMILFIKDILEGRNFQADFLKMRKYVFSRFICFQKQKKPNKLLNHILLRKSQKKVDKNRRKFVKQFIINKKSKKIIIPKILYK